MISRMRALSVFATVVASGSRQSFSVTSRYASSSESGSTSAVQERRIAITCCDTLRYLEKSGETTTSEGHRRSARTIGIAERTPNSRAS